MSEPGPIAPEKERGLARELGAWDVAAITAGTILGSALFIAAAFVPRAVPQPTVVLVLWVVGGLLSIAGALTYAELGTMFPEAGGQYHYLKQAFGPLWGFLFGWTALLVSQSGSVAFLGVAFGEYLGAFAPFFSTKHLLASVSIGGWTWAPNTVQAAGVAAIAALTAVNYFGVRQGARVQNLLTLIKVLSVVGLIVAGLTVRAKVSPDWTAPLPTVNLVATMGLGLLAVLGVYDGWYQATMSGGEVRRPERNLPLGMIGGTVLIAVLYLLANLVYLRALPIADLATSPRIGENAATALLGPGAGRLMAAAVLISTLGCLSSTILPASRLGLPMAQDGLFFRQLARIHPKYRTPGASIVVLGVWSSLLTLSGTYEQLFNYSIFSIFLFHTATGIAVFALRRSQPNTPRPYRVWGYPWVPAIFALSSLGLVVNTLAERPMESVLGVGLVALGVPVYFWMRRLHRAEQR
ncbi:MAG: amino acid permease [Gemmatimonadota bacterium]